MMRRNGGLGKVIVGVILFFGAVYVIYLYNDLSGQLKNTERTAERYRREQESVSAQLQVQYGHIGRLEKALQQEKLKYKASLDDLTASKNELKVHCDNDKQEMANRLNSLNQQHKMLKSQHDDMESEFGRLQSEHDREADEHKRLDDERTLEYNQFKQEKILEISNLRDTVANLEREKEQLTEEIAKLKLQLQNSLTKVTEDKQTISQLQQEVKQQKPQNDTKVGAAEQNSTSSKLQLQTDQQTIQDLKSQLNQAQNLVQQAAQQQQNLQQQQQQNLQQQNLQQQNLQQNLQQGQQQNLQQQQNFQPGQQQNLQVGQQQQQQQGLNQGLNQALNQQLGGGAGLLQQGQPGSQQAAAQKQLGNQQFGMGEERSHQAGMFQQNANKGAFGQQQQQHPIVGGNPDEVKVNLAEEILQSLKDKHKPVDAAEVDLAEEILQSLKDKHKPVDADEVEEQQKQHQILPPLDPDRELKEKEDSKAGKAGVGGDNEVEGAGAGDDDHDNRLQNQGPVGLQVQEPNLKPLDTDNSPHKEGDGQNLLFRPRLPDPVDNQIQPHLPVDDSLKQEQMDKPVHKQDGDEQIDGGDNLEHEDEDEEDYDDDDDEAYDKDDNDNDKGDDAY